MHLSIWQYKRDRHPSFHISGDDEGIDNAARRIRSLVEGRDVIQLNEVTRGMLTVPNKGGLKECRCYKTLLVEFVEMPNKNRGHFVIKGDWPSVSIELSNHSQHALAKAIEGMKDGDGDYTMGHGRTGELWFWWYPR